LVHEPIINFVALRWHTPLAALSAFGLSLVIGGLFWFGFERMWMQGLIRDRSVAWLKPQLESMLDRLGSPRRLCLTSDGRRSL